MQVTLTPDALEQFAALDTHVRSVVGLRLSDLADGNWLLLPQQQQWDVAAMPPAGTLPHDLPTRAAERRQLSSNIYGSESSFQELMVQLAGVRAYSTAFLGVGRIVFEVAPAYCDKYSCYVDMLRVWGVTLTEQEHGEALDRIIVSHSRSGDVLEGEKFLQPIVNDVTAQLAGSNGSSSNEQEPVYYKELPKDSPAVTGVDLPVAFAQRRPRPSNKRPRLSNGSSSTGGSSGSDIVRVTPPASPNLREYTMLRLLDVTTDVMRKLLSPEGLDLQYEDIPFR